MRRYICQPGGGESFEKRGRGHGEGMRKPVSHNRHEDSSFSVAWGPQVESL